MNLILTSKGFGNPIANKKIKENLTVNIQNARVLFIPTALSGLHSYEKYLPDFINFGFKKDNIIIFDYKNAFKYKNLNIDVIYVCGGNTFTLLKLIKECGFDEDIKRYIQEGVIYIGRSAGTHLVTKNIKHILHFDENHIGLKDFNALGLFDGIVFCHYSADRKQAYIEAKLKNEFNVYKITDEEIIFVNEKKAIII